MTIFYWNLSGFFSETWDFSQFWGSWKWWCENFTNSPNGDIMCNLILCSNTGYCSKQFYNFPSFFLLRAAALRQEDRKSLDSGAMFRGSWPPIPPHRQSIFSLSGLLWLKAKWSHGRREGIQREVEETPITNVFFHFAQSMWPPKIIALASV